MIEAVASELPVIGPKAGGTVDVVGDEVKGFLFEKCSAIDLAEKLYLLLSGEVLRKKFSINAKIVAKTKYSWDKVALKMFKVYKAVL
ncbi:MAG: glycosyltransferase [Candidatus Nezhaarchaeales archaeon]